MILYSKQAVTDNINSMKTKGRLAHAFLLIGEKGVGKKVMADYIAKMLMCENGNACGKCRHCKRIENNTHPDVIRPERSGKKQLYNKETMRNICTDAYIFPNDCDSKVYIFSDCESIEENTQNLILKLIEEPPDHAYFIFTATGRGVFLPTVLSRVITLGVNECSVDECHAALTDMGKYNPADIDNAVSHFHGNIGRCVEFLENGDIVKNTEACMKIVDGMIAADEYAIIKTLAQLGENREVIKEVLMLFDKVVRDACIARLGSDTAEYGVLSCYYEGAKKLSDKLSYRRAEAVHDAVYNTLGLLSGNVNCSVAMSALGGILAE